MRRVATLLSDPRTPALPRAAVILALLYLVSPVDLIPEALFGVVGYLYSMSFASPAVIGDRRLDFAERVSRRHG